MPEGSQLYREIHEPDRLVFTHAWVRPDGTLTVPQGVAQLRAEGARRIVVVSDDPDKYLSIDDLAPGTEVALAVAVASGEDGAVLVAHAAAWDVAFLEAELARAGHPRHIEHYLDTLTLSRRAFSLPSHRLSALCAELGVAHANAHRAAGDVAALRGVWGALLRALAPTTPRDLWHVRIGERHVRPDLLEAAVAALSLSEVSLATALWNIASQLEALMVERAGKVLRDTEVPAEWTSEGAIQRRALNYAATVLDALAPDAGTAELARLRERAEKAEQERDRIDQWRETAIVERDTYSEERDAADGRVAALTEALGDMVGLFSADNVLRKGTHMNATLKLARAPAAQTPTDPGDGWTWNERLGWIGPDGKPADPRRRG